MKKSVCLPIACLLLSVSYCQAPLQKFEFVNFSKVSITDNFWKPKIDKVATKTLPACINQTEVVTPRIRNFEKVARKKGEKHEGVYYDDSDVYKALEAMAYSLKTHPDSALERKADEWIDKIAAAQQPDGYLNTYYTLGDINKRWTDVEKHEDYCAGHLMEAAVAYYNTTGKRKLLDVAIRFADHIDTTMRLANKKWFSGHEEIELALVKLYKVTNNDHYLKLADWYLAQRGNQYYTYGTNWIKPEYWQDLLAVKKQTEISGHAVRAMYLYTGAADVAAVTGDKDYMNVMKKVWEDVVYRNMYITGGIGTGGTSEAFSVDYDLPNENAYCETCASVGMVFWNQRMCELTGESKYIDVLEKSLYNGSLAGLSISGDHFFYDNPLASSGQHNRREWFGTACCPSNIARLVSSVGDYIYGKSDNGIWVNLFVGSNSNFQIGKTNVKLAMQTDYPWNGYVKLNMDLSKRTKFSLYLRIPGWANGEAAPGDLYKFLKPANTSFTLRINGKDVQYKVENGYAVIEREWKKGDIIEYDMPMTVNYIEAGNQLKYDNGRIAIQRGPMLYCVEGADNKEGVWNLIVPVSTNFTIKQEQVLTEPVIALQGEVLSAAPSQDGNSVIMQKRTITAIPYYAWDNRGANEMQVWLPVKVSDIKIGYQTKYNDGGNN
jgi:uncharacterized protein